jgi:Mce-associated membrane protein
VTPEPVTPEPVTPEPATIEPAPYAVAPAAPAELAPVTAVPTEFLPVGADPAGSTAGSTVDAPVEPAPGVRSGSLARAGVACLVVLAVLSGALLAVATSRLAKRHDVSNAGDGAVAAAAGGVRSVLSYDYRHLSADFATAERLLTPKFRKSYVDTTSKGVQPLAVKYKAITSASVNAAGLVSANGERARVLVLVAQTVTNSQLAQPRLDRARIDVSLVKINGRWLIDNLNPV